MGPLDTPTISPTLRERDEADHAKLRHGRETHVGRLPRGGELPAPLLFTRDGHNVFLGHMYRGGHAFLACSGPSLNSHNLSLLQQRGIITCSVNNAATIVRSQLWVSVDDPGNFSDAIWRDPGILKFTPLCHMEKPFRIRTESGELAQSSELVGDMPAVFGFRRNEAFQAEQFLYEDTFNWGNHGQRTDAYGIRGSRSVMLVAIRLLFHLGVRTVYLLGCDFKMQVAKENYAFAQTRSLAAVNGNNKTFHALNVRFKQLLPYFEREGFRVFNCTPDSGLTAFPYLDFETAVNQSLEAFPERIDTSGMYDRAQRERDSAKPAARKPGPSFENEQPVAIPELALLTYLDERTVNFLPYTWRTWMVANPWLKNVPAVVLIDRDWYRQTGDGAWRKKLELEHPDLQIVPWQPQQTLTGRNRWSQAFFDYPAQKLGKPWYLRLEPEAIATSRVSWLRPDWFQASDDGGQIAWVAPPWGYTKPADALTRLDDWGDRILELSTRPRLNVPYSSNQDSIRHEAISSWLFIGNTNWTREIAPFFSSQPPSDSHDTLAAYIAARRGDRVIRWPFKQHGWEHSFRHLNDIPKRCAAVLEALGEHADLPNELPSQTTTKRPK